MMPQKAMLGRVLETFSRAMVQTGRQKLSEKCFVSSLGKPQTVVVPGVRMAI
jgi:hypothetical protein